MSKPLIVRKHLPADAVIGSDGFVVRGASEELPWVRPRSDDDAQPRPPWHSKSAKPLPSLGGFTTSEERLAEVVGTSLAVVAGVLAEHERQADDRRWRERWAIHQWLQRR
jgi:hypothetical protein